MTTTARIELGNNSLYYDKDIPYKCMVVFYKFLHLFFGLDLGFVEFKVLGAKYSKLITIVHCIFVLTIAGLCIYLIPAIQYMIPEFLCFVIEYFLFLLILMRIKKETTFYNLYQNLRAIDSGLHVRHSSYHLEIKLFVCIFIWFLFKVWILSKIFFYLLKNEDSNPNLFVNVLHILLHILVNVTTDIVRISCTFMFCAIKCRLNKLKLLLKTKQSGFLSMQYLYRSIVDIAEQHKESFDPVLLTSLLYNVPQAMALILKVVKDIKSFGILQEDMMSIVYNTVIEMLLLTILPAICAGMLTSQAKEIKVILHDLLLKQQEYSAQYREIERFIRYVDARGCRFRVYKLIPLDASLLWMVVSFCVTYLIVIIQFIYK